MILPLWSFFLIFWFSFPNFSFARTNEKLSIIKKFFFYEIYNFSNQIIYISCFHTYFVEIPTAIYLECPNCKKETIHQILKSKGKSVLNLISKCNECEQTHSSLLKKPESIEIPIIISDRDKAVKSKIELDTDEELETGNPLIVDEIPVIITSIETEKRVIRAKTSEIKTIWAKRYDKLKIKVSINKADKTVSKSLIAVPDEEFFIGDILTFGRMKVVVHAIKTNDRSIKRGFAPARDIVRVYGRMVR